MDHAVIRSAAAASGIRRAALVTASAARLVDMQPDLISEIVRRRYRVLCLAPEPGPTVRTALERLGAEFAEVSLAPGGGFLAEFSSRRSLAARLNAFAPHAVAVFDARAFALTAAPAARSGASRIVAVLAELGAATGASDRELATHGLDRGLVKAMRLATAAIVHTANDMRRLTLSGAVPAGITVASVAGAGIDLIGHPLVPLPPLDEGLVFLLAPAIERASGAAEFAAAARKVVAAAPGARFVGIERTATVADIAGAHIVVAPGHGAGIPRLLLAGMAAGRPVIVADRAGARDTVDERVNGCLVPPGDSAGLADAMLSMLARPDLIVAMARASRLKAERRFDVAEVNRVLLGALDLSPALPAAA